MSKLFRADELSALLQLSMWSHLRKVRENLRLAHRSCQPESETSLFSQAEEPLFTLRHVYSVRAGCPQNLTVGTLDIIGGLQFESWHPGQNQFVANLLCKQGGGRNKRLSDGHGQ